MDNENRQADGLEDAEVHAADAADDHYHYMHFLLDMRDGNFRWSMGAQYDPDARENERPEDWEIVRWDDAGRANAIRRRDAPPEQPPYLLCDGAGSVPARHAFIAQNALPVDRDTLLENASFEDQIVFLTADSGIHLNDGEYDAHEYATGCSEIMTQEMWHEMATRLTRMQLN